MSTKPLPKIFNDKKTASKMDNFCILPLFLLFTILLLIIWCLLLILAYKKHQPNQKHMSQY